MPVRDYCKGCRSSYDAIVRFLAANDIFAILFAGIPNYVLIGLVSSQASVLAYTIYAPATYTILSVLLVAWILAGLCIVRQYPNLLSVSIFIYNCLAHWSLVSVLIMLFYGWKYFHSSLFGPVFGTLLPLILSLFVCADVLRKTRQRLFLAIEHTSSQLSAVESSFTGEEKTASPV